MFGIRIKQLRVQFTDNHKKSHEPAFISKIHTPTHADTRAAKTTRQRLLPVPFSLIPGLTHPKFFLVLKFFLCKFQHKKWKGCVITMHGREGVGTFKFLFPLLLLLGFDSISLAQTHRHTQTYNTHAGNIPSNTHLTQ